MKILILTWCNSTIQVNYGQVLQCYALQHICEKLGHEASVLGYRKLNCDESRTNLPAFGTTQRAQYEIEQSYRHSELNGERKLTLFLDFAKKYIHLTEVSYCKEEIEEEIKKYDVLLVGSDQLWNPLWIDDVFLIKYDYHNKKLISYATGGISSVTEKNEYIIRAIAKELEKFAHVSVREPISKQILMRYVDKQIEDVIDPTLLLDTYDYNEISTERLIMDEYVFAFYIGPIQPQKHLIRAVKDKYEVKKVIYIIMNHISEGINDTWGLESVDEIGPREFISLIREAKAVCTDSFHGMVFSILYQKDFFLMDRADTPREHVSEERCNNIMDKYAIPRRYSNSREQIEALSPIDYSVVLEKRKNTQKKCLNWLLNALDN